MDSQPDPQAPVDPQPVVKRYPAPDWKPDWAAALTCPYACGLRHCPWECPAVLDGDAK